MNGLVAESIRKHHGNQVILNDIFISCKPGEIVGLFGRNGSGKSTLLKIIFGTINADFKYIAIDGKKIDDKYKHSHFIKYLPQDNFLPNHICIKEIIKCFCIKEEIRSFCEDPFINSVLNKRANHLSGGERRILEIMLLINSEATYLLLDEPFNGISPVNVEFIKGIISETKDKGIIITDHNYQDVIDISSQMILLDQGNTKKIVKIDELSIIYLPRHYMQGHVSI